MPVIFTNRSHFGNDPVCKFKGYSPNNAQYYSKYNIMFMYEIVAKQCCRQTAPHKEEYLQHYGATLRAFNLFLLAHLSIRKSVKLIPVTLSLTNFSKHNQHNCNIYSQKLAVGRQYQGE